MDLQDASFDTHDIEAYAMGAGVIPLSTHPETGEPHLLLGRERWLATWKGSCRWSGFEGSRKPTESLVASAVREFHEESLDVIDELTGHAALQDALHAGRFWIRVVLRIAHERRHAERYHATYVVPIAWDAALPDRFQTRRSTIEYIDRLVQEMRHTRPEVLGEPGVEVGPLFADDNGSVVVRRRACESPCILRAPWGTDPDDATVTKAIVHDPALAQQLLAWNLVRLRLERALIDHPCVRVARDPRWRILQDVTIVRDHLEKDQMRWWSASELRVVLTQRGMLETHRFRPYFMPVLQTILRELDARSAEAVAASPPTAPTCEPCAPPQSAPASPAATPAAPPRSAPAPR